jgi:hypothetical protein
MKMVLYLTRYSALEEVVVPEWAEEEGVVDLWAWVEEVVILREGEWSFSVESRGSQVVLHG